MARAGEMSEREVAKHYASGANGKAATVFEIQMGMVDRGADISFFSQYPHEKEICFAPLTGCSPCYMPCIVIFS